jgi:hypothetical protein
MAAAMAKPARAPSIADQKLIFIEIQYDCRMVGVVNSLAIFSNVNAPSRV